MTIQESSWQFVTSTGAELSFATPILRVGANATVGALWLKEGETGPITKLRFAGVGGGLSLALISFPVNLSFSIPQMPSAGTVYQLPFAGRTLSLGELKGPFVLLGAAADAGAGWGQSLMFLGGSMNIAAAAALVGGGGLHVAALLATSNACVRFGGMSSTVLPFNVGLCAYLGLLK